MSNNLSREMANETGEEEEDTLANKYLTFQLGNEEYGLEIRYVTEILGIQKITKIPRLPDFIKGVINLRGRVIPVMDVRIRFKMEPKTYDERTCVIVVNIQDRSVGLIVDTVSEVVDIPESEIEPPPTLGDSAGNEFVQGMGKIEKTIKILLNINKLLYEKEVVALDAIPSETEKVPVS